MRPVAPRPPHPVRLARSSRLPVAAFAAVLAGGLAAATPAAAQKTLNVGALPQGSLSYAIGATVAKAIGDNTDLKTRAIGFGGSNIYIPMLDQGKLEFTTGNSLDAAFAATGKEAFEGKKLPNVRILAKLFTFQTGFMVPKDSDVQKLTDFKGKRFPSGFSAQKIVDVLVRGAFATEGMTYKDVRGVPVPNFVRATDAMVAGRVAGSFLAVGSAIVRKANAAKGVRFIDMTPSPEKEKILASIAPGAYYTVVKPSKRMPYITKPTTVVGFDFLILVGKHVPDDVAFKAAKALHDNKKQMIQGHGVFRAFDPSKMAKPSLSPAYHPGAIKYYKEIGIWPEK